MITLSSINTHQFCHQEAGLLQSGLRHHFHAYTLHEVFASSLGYSMPLIQLATNVLGRQCMISQVLGSMPPLWETGIEFLAPSFSLAYPWWLWIFEEWISRWQIFVSLALSMSLSTSDKWTHFKGIKTFHKNHSPNVWLYSRQYVWRIHHSRAMFKMGVPANGTYKGGTVKSVKFFPNYKVADTHCWEIGAIVHYWPQKNSSALHKPSFAVDQGRWAVAVGGWLIQVLLVWKSSAALPCSQLPYWNDDIKTVTILNANSIHWL